MLFSLVPGMRAARRIGAAERCEKRGDVPGALRAHSEALEILGRPRVDLEMGWCRSAASVALWGYARTARKLGLERDLQETLTRWKPAWLRWKDSPLTLDEATYLKWFEELLDHFQRRAGGGGTAPTSITAVRGR